MEKVLKKLSKLCLKNGWTRLSMPKIGCGLDKLEWQDVSDLIVEHLIKKEIAVTVYLNKPMEEEKEEKEESSDDDESETASEILEVNNSGFAYYETFEELKQGWSDSDYLEKSDLMRKIHALTSSEIEYEHSPEDIVKYMNIDSIPKNVRKENLSTRNLLLLDASEFLVFVIETKEEYACDTSMTIELSDGKHYKVGLYVKDS
jgi:hypothetical protein